MLNFLCLFHKCGNVYMNNVHKEAPDIRYVRRVKRDRIDAIPAFDIADVPVNVRCCNFSAEDFEKAGYFDLSRARFLVFTRHPASFILSAVRYHLKAREPWARKVPQPALGHVPLAKALRTAGSEDERQIVAMTYFAALYRKQAAYAAHFDRPNVMRVRCEEIFTTRRDAYYRQIAAFLRLENRPQLVQALKAASPAFKSELTHHSTGAFRLSNPAERLGEQAREVYQETFLPYAQKLGYAQADARRPGSGAAGPVGERQSLDR